jgi:hypothetical protein
VFTPNKPFVRTKVLTPCIAFAEAPKGTWFTAIDPLIVPPPGPPPVEADHRIAVPMDVSTELAKPGLPAKSNKKLDIEALTRVEIPVTLN